MEPLVWVAAALTALSGFFSLTGFALRSFRRVGLEEAFEGPNRQKRLDILAERIKALRLTASLGGALSNLALAVTLLFLFDSLSPAMRVLATMVTAGVLLAIFSVAIPHAWAAHAGEKALASSLRILLGFRIAMYPIISAMEAFDLPIHRLSGAGDGSGTNGDSAKLEILKAASEGQAEGAVDADEFQMIESVMEFSETQAGEIMTPRTDMFALPVETPWDEAVESLRQAGHTRVPVYEGDIDHIVGILYAKDMLGRGGDDSIQSILRKCYFVPETKPLDDLLTEFKARKVHLAIILDEYGGTAGLVTIEDVLEEIVGDIADEYDKAVGAAPLSRIDDRTAEVDGRFRVDELNDELKLHLPEDEDYDTIAGFVFSELGYIPTVDETLESHGVKVTVLAADERKISRLKIELLEPDRDEE